MATSEVDICTDALLLIGEQGINALDDTTINGAYCLRFYPRLRSSILSMHSWRFATKFQQLTRDTAYTAAGFTYQHLLPPDRLVGQPIRFFPSNDVTGLPLDSFNIFADKVRSHAIDVWSEYRFPPPEAAWPAMVQELAVLALGAQLALVITEQRELAKDLREQAWGTPQDMGRGGKFRSAALLDAQSSPSESLAEFHSPLTAARHGAGQRRY